MRLSKFTLIAAAIGMAGMSCVAQAQSNYDFAYQSSDPRILAFDDGGQTRLQLPEGVLLPTVLAIRNQGEVLVPLRRDGPYLVTQGVYTRLVLKWGNAREVNIQYTGHAALSTRNGPAVAYGAAPPEAVYSPAPRPVPAMARADDIPAPQIAGIAEFQQAFAPATPVEAPVSGFDFLPSDNTISGTIRRWARDTGYELVWELPVALDPVIRKTGSLKVTTMKDALEAVLAGLRLKGYPVNARMYSDRVIHFTVAGQSY